MTPRSALDAGIAALALDVPESARARLIRYVELIDKWNHTYNLTAVRAQQDMIPQHILDSLSVVPALAQRADFIDIGSGAGLPGIPLAIVRPGRRAVLLDSNQKKATFLRQAVIELELQGVEVVADRVEHYRPAPLFSTVIARAFADLGEFVRICSHLAAPDGEYLAMKGLYPYEETGRLPEGFVVQAIDELDVPGLDAHRHLVRVRRK